MRGEPDYSVNMTVKRFSGKRSWTVHKSRRAAVSEEHRVNQSTYQIYFGCRFRFRYRINIYLKESQDG